MGFGKFLKRVARVALPVAGAMFGGPAGAALGGAVGGAVGGGGVEGALKGGILGGLGGLAASGLGSILGSTAGSALGGGMQGATQGSGILGGLTGGTTGFKIGSIGNLLGGGLMGSPSSVLTGGGSGGSITGLLKPVLPNVADLGSAMPWLSGGGAAVAPSGLSGGIGSLVGSGKGLASTLLPLSSIYSGMQGMSAQAKARDDLIDAQSQAMAAIQPYQQSGQVANQMLTGKLQSGELGGAFNPGDLTQTPGYQFALDQGNKALAQRQAASGNYFSGAALKEAQDYGTQLANQTYGDEYNRWLQQQQQTYGMLSGQGAQGLGAAGAAGDIYSNIGAAKAGAGIGKSNVLNQSLAGFLGGQGILNTQPQFDKYGNLVRV